MEHIQWELSLLFAGISLLENQALSEKEHLDPTVPQQMMQKGTEEFLMWSGLQTGCRPHIKSKNGNVRKQRDTADPDLI